MRTREAWHILIVDDEPDVHTVTALVLKREKVFGVPLVLHHAHSAAEAIKLVGEKPELSRDMAVALIDVVMETDDAGLKLVEKLRNDCKLLESQLLLRTGQPGKAPPRDIVERYDVSGYLTKADATGERLVITLRAGIQNYFHLRACADISGVLGALVNNCGDITSLRSRLVEYYESTRLSGAPLQLALSARRHEVACGDFGAREGLTGNTIDELRLENGILKFSAEKGDGAVSLRNPVFPRQFLTYYGELWRNVASVFGYLYP